MEASNQISGTYRKWQTIEVVDDNYDVILDCPSSQILGNGVQCFGSVGRGAPHPIKFHMGDGKTEILVPSKLICYETVW